MTTRNDGGPAFPFGQVAALTYKLWIERGEAAQHPAEPVKVNAIFETQNGEVIGTTDAKVKRVEWQDDGSLTVVIDHWPQPSEPVKVPSDDIDIDDVHQYLEAWGCLAHPGVRALLARYGQPVEPEGWKLVPAQPTVEMSTAAKEESKRWSTRGGEDETLHYRTYVAMLAAAPKFGEEE